MITKDIPVFPNYIAETIEDNIYTFKSSIHIHKETEDVVKVYLFPVESTYVAKTAKEKDLVAKAHLRECFRLSKYINTDKIGTSTLPYVTTLLKIDPSFQEKLHYMYM